MGFVKIKYRFLVINTLLLIIPILTGLFFNFQDKREQEKFILYTEEIKNKLILFDEEHPEFFSNYLKYEIEYIYLNLNKEIIYSSNPSEDKNHLNLNSSSGKHREVSFKINSGYLVFYSVSKNLLFQKPNLKSSMIELISRPLLASLVTVIIVSVLSVFTLKDISKTISNIKFLSKKISDGELTYPIAVPKNNDFAPLYNSLKELQVELLQSKDKRARFIMGISHDLKTPLALIKGYVEALSDGIYSDENEKNSYLEIINNKSSELEEIITDLIDLSRLDTGEWKTQLEKQSIGNVLYDLSKKYRMDCKMKNIKFSFESKDDLILNFDKKLFIRVMDNLFSNSLKAVTNNGEISLSIKNENNKTLIKLQDNGIGINKDDLNLIFEPFFKGSRSRTSNGHGLGLATVKTIIDNHGWNIDVKSPSFGNIGTCTTIIINDL